MARRRRPTETTAPPEPPADDAAAPSTPPGPTSSEGVEVSLRTADGQAFRFPSVPRLRQVALRWAYFVANRRRWTSGGLNAEEQGQRSAAQLQEFGVTPDWLRRFADAGLVEVGIPYATEAQGWEARIFPWEYMLSAATKAARGEKPLTVVRHLDRQGAAPPTPRVPQRLSVVQTAPGALADIYLFDAERRLVESSLGLANPEPQFLDNPTATRLRDALGIYRPDVVHVTGIDAHQGAELLKLEKSREVKDGLFLKDERECPLAVDAEEVARLLTAGKPEPVLVTLNLYNSAARIAALTVAEGAGAAIGFQDVFDDDLSDLFFGSLFHAWRVSSWDILRAFEEARLVVPKGSGFGSGVVLWSGRSLVTAAPGTPPRRSRTSPDEAPDEVARQLKEEKRKPILLETTAPAGAPPGGGPPVAAAAGTGGGFRDAVQVEVHPHDSLNYSLLHNNRGLFKAFTITKLRPGYLQGVQVQVVLHVGEASFPYRATLDLVEPVTFLTDRVKVPLTSALARSVMESVHTSLYVEVTCQGQPIYCDTHRITLLPVDEWRDDNPDRIWLPSFVLPRDPAVAQIVAAAQRYLMALADDSSAGFDGYQSLRPGADDPAEGVDLQVRALWSALAYDFPLSYINPPPSYSKVSQRLRTPSQVLAGKRGTCIDLALLLASCLEYVDIYPVIFLLKGHAFAGYWRSDEYHQENFKKLSDLLGSEAGAAALPGQSPVGNVPKEPWRLGEGTYPEVVQRVLDRQLVPLETVWLTRRSGFGEALDRGVEDLRSQADFDFLIDIVLARQNQVTPLPIGGPSA